MNESQDREFEDFLRRRRPVFRRGEDDALEPPPELDRIVLRQAREAIQESPPQRLYRGPRWGAGLSIAATLVVGLAFVFKAGEITTDVRPQVTIENIAQRMEAPPPAPAPAGNNVTSGVSADAPVMVELGRRPTVAATPAEPADPSAPEWRRNSNAWLAEIERLRASGDAAGADAEMAEYNRQHRALAVSPDR